MTRTRLAVRALEDRTTPSTLIPVTGAQDLVFDAARNRLYVTTASGSVARYDVTSSSLLSAVAAGTSLNGADITPDNRYLYVAENNRGPTQGYFYKIDLADPGLATTLVPYNLGFGEAGAYDIAIGPAGVALTTTRYSGSGWVDTRLLDTATDTFTLAGRGVRQDSHLDRSGDRTLVVVAESNISSGPYETYTFGGGWSAEYDSGQFLGAARSAVNRDGTLIASEVGAATAVVTPTFDAAQTLTGFDGGMAFDPTRNVLYAVNSATDQIAAFDTATWRELYRLPTDENVSSSNGLGAGVMAVSGDGTKLFLVTPTGVRRYDLPAATGVASRLMLSNVSTFRAAGTPATVTVTALDPAGNVVTNFAGTVSFTSTDPAAGLPAAYTFNPGTDAGVHTFTVTWNTAGSRTLTVSDAAHGLSVTTPAVTVTTGTVSLIPVATRRDLVYDDAHGLLLITTSAGTVERYDPASRSLLAPLVGGGTYNGADVTPDGTALFVAEGQRSLVKSIVRRIDPLTGAMTALSHAGDGGAWDVAIGGGGIGAVDYLFEGSGWVTLDRLDAAANTLTSTGHGVRQNSNLYRGAGRNLTFGTESNISSGPIWTYDPATNTFPASAGTNAFLDNSLAAVNRTGTLIAGEIGSATAVVTPTFDTVQLLAGYDGGLAFDPVRDLLYAVNSTTDQIAAFDTNTWAVKYTLPVGENVPASSALGNGVMAVSGDGTKLFLSTPSGVRRFDLPAATGVPTRLVLSNVSTFRSAGTPTTVTVTVQDNAGNVVTNFAGTVSFTSTDPAAALPGPYTFNPATDAGVHTFTVTWNTAGSRTLTATTAVPNSLLVTSPAVTVTSGAVSLIPVTNHRDLVYDDAHGLLLITTSAGTVERYDPASRSLLAPLTGGISYNGADVTPDGSALFVAEGQRSLTQSVLRRIDPLTGATTLVRHNGPDGGAWDVEVAANGTGVADYLFEGSGWVNLDKLDVAAGTVGPALRSVRQNSNLFRGAGRNLFFGTEANISSGPIWTYDPAAGTFPASANTNSFVDSNLAAVNRDGTQIAFEFGTGTTVMNPSLGTVRTLTGIDGGLAYDPVRDMLYAVNSATDQLFAYDTNTGAARYYLPVGENVPASSALGSGVMAASGDGRWVFLATPAGVRVYSVAPAVTVTAAPSVTTGRPLSVTVSVRDPLGNLDSTYRGTVTWTSTDAAAGLPAAYTFTAADAGTHTFTVTPNTVGPQTLTVKDNLGGVLGSTTVTVLPAKVVGVQVADGSLQRSSVRSLTVTFDTAVTFPNGTAASFQLTRTGPSGPTGTVGLVPTVTTDAQGRTVVTLTFSGPLTEPGTAAGVNPSLIDGLYTLTVVGGQASAGGTAVDADGDGAPGGDKVVAFHRLFGDIDGDKDVDLLDLNLLVPALFPAQGNYNPAFDFDGDGDVDLLDLNQFVQRLFVVLP